MTSFVLRYYAELRSKYKGVFWRVEIAERGYSGAAEQMSFDGSDPLKITWEKRGDEFYAPVKASEATINILCQDNFHYIGLFTSDPRKFRVSIYRNTVLYWRGFVTADLYSEKFTAPPYQVSIKAVDGFNLLASYPFRDLMAIGTSGLVSLWSLLTRCIDLLELELDVADWTDLYADTMSEEESPLRQTFVDLARLYYVYEEPTYRDILELCLWPFTAQIFQSGGALHIRRAISLYNDVRPVSFYSVGAEFPSGWLTTADGHTIVTAQGEPIITTTTRERIDSMWNADINISGESTLDIVPALRKVTVNVKNKNLGNLTAQLGFFDIEQWTDPNEFLSQSSEVVLTMCGNDTHQGETLLSASHTVEQCNYPLRWEFSMLTTHREWTAFSYSKPSENYAVKVSYGVQVVGKDATYHLSEGGNWSSTETDIVSEVKTGNDQNIKIDIDGIPCDGEWRFYIRQTLIGKVNTYDSGRPYSSGHMESVTFKSMTLTLDADDMYDSGLQYEAMVNPANNADMSLTLPVSDIPAIPNDRLLYSLYLLDASGNPTRLWHNRMKNDYDTLIGHFVQCALRYKQLPARRITGEMFTGQHIDMNTVVQDDKYLRAGFQINSIELNALGDTFDCELTQMPDLLSADTPAEGDDCITIAQLGFSIEKIVRCMNFLLIQADKTIYLFDTVSRTLREIYTSENTFAIYPADEGFVRVEEGALYYSDYRGAVQKIYAPKEPYSDFATYRDGYFYVLGSGSEYPRGDRDTQSTPIIYHYLVRPEYKYPTDTTTYRRGSGIEGTKFYGDIRSVETTDNTIAVTTSSACYLHDKRFHKPCRFLQLPAGQEAKSVSDAYLCMNVDDDLRLYKRDSITEYSLVGRVGRYANLVTHTVSQVAFSYDSLFVHDIRANTLQLITNAEAGEEPVLGLYYIYGELYIVRPRAIYKYTPKQT